MNFPRVLKGTELTASCSSVSELFYNGLKADIAIGYPGNDKQHYLALFGFNWSAETMIQIQLNYWIDL